MRTGIVYKATCIVTNKIYIGQTVQTLEKRKNAHFCYSYNLKSKEYNLYFHNAIRKYGIDNFLWEIVEKDIPEELLGEKEKKWIEIFNSVNEGYNLTFGGSAPMLNKSHTLETKRKIAASHLGIPKSESHKLKISHSKKGHYTSSETIEKMRKAKRTRDENGRFK